MPDKKFSQYEQMAPYVFLHLYITNMPPIEPPGHSEANAY